MYQKLCKSLFGAVGALMLLAGTATAAEWRGWNIHVDGYPNTIAMDKFAELLAEKTKGEITLKMFHSGTLGSQPDAIDLTADRITPHGQVAIVHSLCTRVVVDRTSEKLGSPLHKTTDERTDLLFEEATTIRSRKSQP